MNATDRSIMRRPVTQETLPRRSYFEAFRLWIRDANKFHLLGVFRVLLLILVGYAPFAALNDALAPFTLGIPFLDDLEIPIGLIAALKIIWDIHRYRNPYYRARR